MKFAVILTDCLFVWLFWRSRKIVCTGSSRTGFIKICYRIGLYLLSKPVFQSVMQEKLSARLSVLYPVYERKSLVKHYYAQKMSTVLMILLAGIHLLFFMEISEQRNSVLQDGHRLLRGGYGQQEETVALSVKGDAWETQVSYPLQARKYSAGEMARQMDDFERQMPELIRGENPSLENVKTPLVLLSSYGEYGFSVQWESADYSLLDSDGTVYNDALVAPQLVTLTAEMTSEDTVRETSVPVRVCPREKTAEEETKETVLRAIGEADRKGRTEETLTLPDKIGESQVTYALSDTTPYLLYLIGLGMIAVVVFYARDRDLEKKMQEREKDLMLRYPEFVSQFVLLTGAGMSVRSVLFELSTENSLGVYLQQELKLLVRDLGNGVLEAQALDTFGKRCGLRPYIKLSGLLIQNMKKGNRELFAQLKEEASDAFSKRKNDARKLGEEAGTKLLLPMMGMLAVVMIVIIVPAFLSFGL